MGDQPTACPDDIQLEIVWFCGEEHFDIYARWYTTQG